jgi:hypothetical protein
MAYASSELAQVARDTAIQDRKLRLFRGTVRSLVRDAGGVVNELLSDEATPGSALERLDLVQHYLSYLLRLCDGRV